MAAGHPISALSVLVIKPTADRHPIFHNQHRAMAEVFAVIIAEKAHPVWQDAPIPPFAGHALHEPAPDGFIRELVIPPDRKTKHMGRKWIVIVQSDVVESRFPLGRVEFFDERG